MLDITYSELIVLLGLRLVYKMFNIPSLKVTYLGAFLTPIPTQAFGRFSKSSLPTLQVVTQNRGI